MHSALPRVLPFAVFMAFIGLEELARFLRNAGIIHFSDATLYYLYPLKAVATLATLLYFWRATSEIDKRDLRNPGYLALSLLVGIGVFLLWIKLDSAIVTVGTPGGFNPTRFDNDVVRTTMIASRLLGAVIIVPWMEELFWRSFLLRYVIKTNFSDVAVGTFTWTSFVVTTILFGLEHNLFVAGMFAGAAYNILAYRTKSILHCIVSHAVTNLALGMYVLYYQKWHFW